MGAASKKNTAGLNSAALSRVLRALPALLFVGATVFFSVATTGTTDPGDDSQCGTLELSGGDPGEFCESRDECNDVCCLCEGGGGFVAFGCDLDTNECLGGDDLCVQALENDPALCDSEEEEG
jgi:hypothetical protein